MRSSLSACVALVLQASTWAEEGQRVLAELEQEHPGVVLQRLQLHWTKHPELPPAHFRKMWALATGLGSEGIRQQCRWAWAQCQDTWLALDQKLEAALKPLPTGSTASPCVSQVPVVPATPPLRKAYSLDRNLGQNLRESVYHCHQAASVAACHRPEAGSQPGLSPTMLLPGSSDPRSPSRYRHWAGQGGQWQGRWQGLDFSYLVGSSWCWQRWWLRSGSMSVPLTIP